MIVTPRRQQQLGLFAFAVSLLYTVVAVVASSIAVALIPLVLAIVLAVTGAALVNGGGGDRHT